jgi:hypothetical protein
MPSNIKYIQNLEHINLKNSNNNNNNNKFTRVLFWWVALHPEQYYKVL